MSILDTTIVSEINKEYLDFVNRYKDLKRTSIFCRYYNVNENISKGTVTFDSHTGYDIYDYTPLNRVNAISDSSGNFDDKSGLKFESTFNVDTYTITTPKINDIVVFPYKPNNYNLIYRVKNITSNINSMIENIKFHSLSLEYAAIKNIDNLKLINHYVYLISEGINITKINYLEFLKNMKLIFDILQSSKFDNKKELYSEYDINENIIILEFLNKFDSYFFNIKKPFYVIFKDLETSYSSNKELINLINDVKFQRSKRIL